MYFQKYKIDLITKGLLESKENNGIWQKVKYSEDGKKYMEEEICIYHLHINMYFGNVQSFPNWKIM